jgi:two-component system response regulator RegA
MEHTILIIDDEPPIRFALRRYFTSHGWVVDTAATVEEAQALCEAGPYEAALVDLRLGDGRSGLELIDSIRARSPETRLVMLTAYGSREVELEARERGVDALLNKPKPLAEIAAVLDKLVGPSHPPVPGVRPVKNERSEPLSRSGPKA